ncbi:protein phosphatase 2C domain-containing protein [Propioniciclava sp.]|uniref:PP2C family protein-serine/threonine phosphatase n=1 Tax=Propioniciclava sp. TaxID=2038686 RepID=UPI0026286703|nr:protein phosphatase 2C domain-containing protein [Propioniciclava sp.]
MSLSLAYDAHTEIGLVRTNNQDSAFVSPRMLMVADGMGGAAAGDLASAVATWELEKTDADLAARLEAARAEREASPDAVAHDEDAGSLTDVLTVMASTLAHANEKIVELVEDDPSLAGMGTTVCGFVLHDDRLAVVNIGDSRAYLVRDGQLHRVTRDHSWVQTLVDEGRITEAEALDHPHRHLVLRVLNGSSQHEPDLGWLDIAEGDRLLVCSDGLCGLVTDAAIAEVATTGAPRPEVIEQLVALAHAAGGYDNITMVLADVVADAPSGVTEAIGAAAIVTLPSEAERTITQLPVVAPDAAADAAADDRAMTEEERYALQGRRGMATRVKVLLLFLVPLLALVAGGGAWYGYTQTQFFVGPNHANVAVYRGVPDQVLGLPLSTLVETDETLIENLPPYYAERVRGNIRVESLQSARTTVVELRQKAAECVAQREARARASASPTPAPDATGSPSPDPGAPSPGASAPTPGATPTWPSPAPSAMETDTSLSPTPGVTPTSPPVGQEC